MNVGTCVTDPYSPATTPVLEIETVGLPDMPFPLLTDIPVPATIERVVDVP